MIRITPLLERLLQGIPNLTDHGVAHTKHVLSNLCDLIREYSIPVKFTEDERFLLVLAAITHDIGCIAGRDNHAERSVKILQKNRYLTYLLDTIGDLNFNVLTKIIKWHSKESDLEAIGPDPCDEIRLKLIASIFRLADACCMSRERINIFVLSILVDEKLLPIQSEEIWRAHLEVEEIKISGNKIQPIIFDLAKADYCLTELAKELEPINQVLINLELPPFILESIVIDLEGT